MINFARIEAAKATLADPDCMKSDVLLIELRNVASACERGITAVFPLYNPDTDKWIPWALENLTIEERTLVKNTYNSMINFINTING